MNYYSQKDPRWASETLGTCKGTIGKIGCKTTCLAMIAGIRPDIVNDKLLLEGCYQKGCHSVDALCAETLDLEYYGRETNPPNYACIAETNHYASKGVPQHFFILLPSGKKIDPLHKNPRPAKNNYKVVSYRLFKPKSTPKKYEHGLDVSHWQKKINWRSVAKDKKELKFVFIKASQGISYTDKMMVTNLTGARDNGLETGFYHFADGGNAENEARHFIQTVRPHLKDDDILILDWEIDHEDPLGWCSEFCNMVESQTSNKVMIYTNDRREKDFNFKNLGYDIWNARFGRNTGKPDKKPEGSWDIWQYTSAGSVDGINGDVDLNIRNMKLEKDSQLDKRLTAGSYGVFYLAIAAVLEQSAVHLMGLEVSDASSFAIIVIAGTVMRETSKYIYNKLNK